MKSTKIKLLNFVLFVIFKEDFVRLKLLRKFTILGLLLLLIIQVTTANDNNDKPLLGFSRESAAKQRALEVRFDSYLKKDNLRQWMERITARPHHLSSAYDKENAEFIASQFRSWGYETEIEVFQVLFPTPKKRLLEMIAPEKFAALLREPPLSEDSTSSQTDEPLDRKSTR